MSILDQLDEIVRHMESCDDDDCQLDTKYGLYLISRSKALIDVARAAKRFADCYVIKEPANDDYETKEFLKALAKLEGGEK